MKKFILTLTVALSIASCKKSETTDNGSSNNIETSVSDSTAENTNSIQNSAEITLDSAAVALREKEILKLRELNEEKKSISENFVKGVDSTTKRMVRTEIKLNKEKIDSLQKIAVVASKKLVKPRVITKTKVIYKNIPAKNSVAYPPKITKKGEIELVVDDLENANYNLKNELAKYDGEVKNEQISTGKNNGYNYLQVSIPLDKSEFFIENLERNVGEITSRNIEISGQAFAKNSVCNLEITLVNNSEKAIIGGPTKSFGGRTLGAVGSGWKVIEEIFLFILPFWPLILIGSVIYYFLKKKRPVQVK